MTSSASKIVVLLLLLTQALLSLGAGQSTILLAERHACRDHACSDHGRGDIAPCDSHPAPDCDHHSSVRLFSRGVPPAPGEDCAPWCCGCPHIHLQVQDNPVTPGEPRNIRDSIPPGARAAQPAAGDVFAPLFSTQNSPWRVHHLEADHPPPVGLLATRLRI